MTSPISRRPPESTSIQAISSATRTGSGRLATGLPSDSSRAFFVCRARTAKGSGTVVTGTVFNGTVRTGDKLVISPAGREVRVRGIQIHGKAADQARAGERCALNLTGTDVESVRRGDWVMAAAIQRIG